MCVLVSHPGQAGCAQIYPRRDLGNSATGSKEIVIDDFVPLGHLLPSILATGLLDSSILNGIEHGNGSSGDDDAIAGAGSSLSKALSKALCVTHRQVSLNEKLLPRVLVMQLRKDHPPCYNSIMNSIFSADRFNCPIDAVVLSQIDSHFLQQACYLTRGTYQCPPDQRDLLQILLTHCLASSSSREVLQGCVQKTVDFRATCYCHKTPVEFAYLCSVCLALSCEPRESCTVCGTVATVT